MSLPLFAFGGATRDRTADLLNAIQALSQLSYSPLATEPTYSKDADGLSTGFFEFFRRKNNVGVFRLGHPLLNRKLPGRYRVSLLARAVPR